MIGLVEWNHKTLYCDWLRGVLMLPEELEMNQENLKNLTQRSMFGHFRTYIIKYIN